MTTKKPTYFEMCKEAIVALKDRTGSSGIAIKAYIVKTYPTLDFTSVSFHIYTYYMLLTANKIM